MRLTDKHKSGSQLSLTTTNNACVTTAECLSVQACESPSPQQQSMGMLWYCIGFACRCTQPIGFCIRQNSRKTFRTSARDCLVNQQTIRLGRAAETHHTLPRAYTSILNRTWQTRMMTWNILRKCIFSQRGLQVAVFILRQELVLPVATASGADNINLINTLLSLSSKQRG